MSADVPTGDVSMPISASVLQPTRCIRNLNRPSESGMKMSVDKVLEIAKIITTLRIRLSNGVIYTETLYTTP